MNGIYSLLYAVIKTNQASRFENILTGGELVYFQLNNKLSIEFPFNSRMLFTTQVGWIYFLIDSSYAGLIEYNTGIHILDYLSVRESSSNQCETFLIISDVKNMIVWSGCEYGSVLIR